MSGVDSTTYSSNIRLFEREIRNVEFEITNDNGTPLDLTGAVAGFKIGNKSSTVIDYAIGSGLEYQGADPTLGIIIATIDLDDPDPPAGVYTWELRITLDDEVKTLETGQVRIIWSAF